MGVRIVAVIALAIGCGRIDFDPAGDANAAPSLPVADASADNSFCAHAAFGNPGTSSYVDDFATAPLTERWNPNNACIVESSGGLIATPPEYGDTCHAWTLGDRHLTCDSVTMHAALVTQPIQGAETFMYVRALSGGVQLSLTLEAGSFQLESVAVATPYNTATDQWWRLREDDGAVFFETAPDGLAWTPRAQIPTPFSVDHVEIALGARTFGGTIDGAGNAEFRCYNVPPPCR
jgi:hypothetical protein